ncbi:MAG: right-handed parallel beta-helix repeat-containing protein, partial [Chloroflexota bacterium]
MTPSSLLTHRISFLQQSHLTQTEQSDYQDKDISANIKQTAPAGDRPMSAPTNHLQTMARGRVRASSNTASLNTASNNIITVCADANCDHNSVHEAVSAAQPGDHIKIATGTYKNPDIAAEGRFLTINKEITLSGGYDGTDWSTADPIANPTILDGEEQGAGLYMQTGGITVTVQGLTIQRARGQGIYASNTRVIIDNSHIISTTGSSNSAISLSSSHGSQIRRSTIQHSATAISLSSSHDVVIEDNTIEQNSTGVSLVASHRFLIKRNRIIRNTGSGLTANYWSSSSNGTITANIIAKNGGTGLFINGSRQQIDNNMIVINDGYGIDWRSGNGIMYHNTIADNDGDAGVYVQSGVNVVLTNTIISGHTYGIRTASASGNVQANHTLWFSNTNDTAATGGLNIVTTNDLHDNPLFVGTGESWDAYHLTFASPAIDAGGATDIDKDVDGEGRAPNIGPDIGADEYPHVLTLSDGQSETTTPNSTVTYVHILRNSGGVTDTVNLTANSSQNWAVSVEPSQVTVGVGMAVPVTVTVLVPADAGTDMTTLTAQSTLDGHAIHTVTDVTSTEAGMTLTPNHSEMHDPGSTVTYVRWRRAPRSGGPFSTRWTAS